MHSGGRPGSCAWRSRSTEPAGSWVRDDIGARLGSVEPLGWRSQATHGVRGRSARRSLHLAFGPGGSPLLAPAVRDVFAGVAQVRRRSGSAAAATGDRGPVSQLHLAHGAIRERPVPVDPGSPRRAGDEPNARRRAKRKMLALSEGLGSTGVKRDHRKHCGVAGDVTQRRGNPVSNPKTPSAAIQGDVQRGGDHRHPKREFTCKSTIYLTNPLRLNRMRRRP
jgi:hypothetical protein